MDIRVVQCGVHYRHGPGFRVDRPRGSGDYVFIHIHTPLSVCIGTKETRQPAGSCILFSPRASYRYPLADQMFDNTWFHADGAGIDKLAAAFGIPIDTPFLPGRCDYIVPLVHEMHQEKLQNALHSERAAGLAVEKLFLLLSRHRDADPHGRLTPAMAEHWERLRQVRMEVLENLESVWTVADMARRAHLSPSRFTAVYRHCFKVSPMEDLIRARLDKAAWLLATTTLPVNAVAAQSGFENVYYFSRLFHRRLGHPPSQHGRRD